MTFKQFRDIQKAILEFTEQLDSEIAKSRRFSEDTIESLTDFNDNLKFLGSDSIKEVAKLFLGGNEKDFREYTRPISEEVPNERL